MRLNAIKSPSNCIWTGDSSPYGGTDNIRAYITPMAGGLPNPRHNGGSNFGFGDGHAQWLNAGDSNTSNMNRWYVDNVVR